MAESYMIAPGTAQELDYKRRLALALMNQGADASPVQAWTQGLARLAQGAMGGYELYQAEKADKDERAQGNALMAQFLAQGSGATSPASGAAPVGNAGANPMGKLPAMGSRVYDQNEFNPLDAAVATKGELAAGVPAPAKYASLIGKAAVDNDLPPQLLAAQLKQESGFNPNAVSPAGASGISQFMPGTARDMGVTDPFNPEQAIPAGARYLRQNIDKFGGSVPLGLAAYNAGPGRVERAGGDISKLPAETQGYVAALSGSQPAAAPAQTAQAVPNRDLLVKMLANRNTEPMARAIIQSQINQQFKQPEYDFKVVGDKLVRTTNRGGAEIVPGLDANKATFGVIGKDEFGKEQYGWIDPSTKTTTPGQAVAATHSQPSTIPPAPAGVDPKIWREAQSKRVTEEGMPAGDEKTSKLRNEVQGLPSYKNLAQAAPVYRSMFDAAGRDNRAADLNLIYGIAKVFDPGSVVREGEMGLAQGIATLPERLQSQVKSALTGEGRLSPELRAAIMQEARSRVLSYQGMFDQDMNMYRGIAQRGRMNEADVIPGFGTFDEFKPPAPKIAAPVEIDGYKIRAK